jgi:hypothetical protein
VPLMYVVMTCGVSSTFQAPWILTKHVNTHFRNDAGAANLTTLHCTICGNSVTGVEAAKTHAQAHFQLRRVAARPTHVVQPLDDLPDGSDAGSWVSDGSEVFLDGESLADSDDELYEQSMDRRWRVAEASVADDTELLPEELAAQEADFRAEFVCNVAGADAIMGDEFDGELRELLWDPDDVSSRLSTSYTVVPSLSMTDCPSLSSFSY